MSNGTPPGHVHLISTESRSLPCNLTDPEKIERGADMASHAERNIELKAEASDISKQAREHAKRAGALAHVIHTGVEMRNVPCEWRADYTARTKICVRTDTGEILETEDLSARELQLSLEAVKPPAEPTPITQAARGRGRGRGRLQVASAPAPSADSRPAEADAPAMITHHEYETPEVSTEGDTTTEAYEIPEAETIEE